MITRTVLGIDPGIRFCGFGVVSRAGGKLVHRTSGHVETFPTASDDERQAKIWRDLTAVVELVHPTLIAYEDQRGVNAAARQMEKRNAEAAARGVKLEQTWFNASNDGVTEVVGIIKTLAFAKGLPLESVQSRSAKVAVLGKGHSAAKKAEVQAVVRRLFGLFSISDHAADAMAIAICAERKNWIDMAARRTG